MGIAIPEGFQFAGVHCGIKRNPHKEDLSLILSDADCAAGGVYTQNRVFAAPVGLDRRRTPSGAIRGVVINSGNANACTGSRGDRDAERMAELAATACGVIAEQMLVMSTGVIGVYLPLERIETGIRQAALALGADEARLVRAARGMLTTDTVHKLAGRECAVAGRTLRICGLAKGAAMIAPRMGTMLAVVCTDAPLSPNAAQSLLSAAVDQSFNCISIDGHMSTNDTVLLLANGRAGGPELSGVARDEFGRVLCEICAELARAIPADGEGATHLVTVDIQGCRTREDAYRIAKMVCESPLVKTAIAGGDPNWGRIVSAAGYAGVPFDVAGVALDVNGFRLFEGGAPAAFEAAVVSRSIKENRDTQVVLAFSEGDAGIRFWTTDLTAEYVRLNADYTT